jgi:hypothetical protein
MRASSHAKITGVPHIKEVSQTFNIHIYIYIYKEHNPLSMALVIHPPSKVKLQNIL